LTDRATAQGGHLQASSAAFDAVSGEVRTAEDSRYRLGHLAPGVWGEVSDEETRFYVSGQNRPFTVPGSNALLSYDDAWDSDLAPRFIGDRDEHPDGSGIFDTSADQWLWRDPALTAPIQRIDGALIGASLHTLAEEKLLARDVET